jgi:hypothetical protein
MHPEIGYRDASSAKHSATSIWPPNTIGQVQKNAAPPEREAEREQLEDRRQNRYEREPGRKGRIRSKAPAELLGISECGEIVLVFGERLWWRCGCAHDRGTLGAPGGGVFGQTASVPRD